MLEDITSIFGIAEVSVNLSIIAVGSSAIGEGGVHESNLEFSLTVGIEIASQLSNGLGWIQSSASVSSDDLLGFFEIFRDFANWNGIFSVIGVINGLDLTSLGSLLRLRTTAIDQTSFLIGSSVVTGGTNRIALSSTRRRYN